MTSSEIPFPSIAIVGLGLIGGSIALGVRERWPESRVFGVDTAPVLAHALGSGAIERGVVSIDDLPRRRADHSGRPGSPEYRVVAAIQPWRPGPVGPGRSTDYRHGCRRHEARHRRRGAGASPRHDVCRRPSARRWRARRLRVRAPRSVRGTPVDFHAGGRDLRKRSSGFHSSSSVLGRSRRSVSRRARSPDGVRQSSSAARRERADGTVGARRSGGGLGWPAAASLIRRGWPRAPRILARHLPRPTRTLSAMHSTA